MLGVAGVALCRLFGYATLPFHHSPYESVWLWCTRDITDKNYYQRRKKQMLGLARGKVKVVPHDSGWLLAFSRERESLRAILGKLGEEIQHVGSTAIPELDAKPILDIAVGIVTWDDLAAVTERLTSAQWIDRGWTIPLAPDGQDGNFLLVKELIPNFRTHHLHVVKVQTLQWNNYIRFRDALRGNPILRHEYMKLKTSLAEKYSQERGAYTAAKDSFIKAVLAR